MKVPITLKQIMLITDGYSNVGLSPVQAAYEAQRQGIVVNVIGVVENEKMNERSSKEINNVAEAGGGLSRIISTRTITHTVQMLTRQAMNISLQQSVQTILRNSLGNRSLEDIPPNDRERIFSTLEQIGEESTLQLVILVDQSESMKKKLPAVEEAIKELRVCLASRSGRNLFKIMTFPGQYSFAEAAVPWTEAVTSLSRSVFNSGYGGKTPTGPALKMAIESFRKVVDPNVADMGHYDYVREKHV